MAAGAALPIWESANLNGTGEYTMASTHQTTPRHGLDAPASPPRYKMTLLTWAAAFLLLTAANVLLRPLLAVLLLPGRPLLLTGLMVGLLTYVIMPRLTQLCASWLALPSAAVGQDQPGAIAEEPIRIWDDLPAELTHARHRRT
jgi:hypothetical protein